MSKLIQYLYERLGINANLLMLFLEIRFEKNLRLLCSRQPCDTGSGAYILLFFVLLEDHRIIGLGRTRMVPGALSADV